MRKRVERDIAAFSGSRLICKVPYSLERRLYVLDSPVAVRKMRSWSSGGRLRKAWNKGRIVIVSLEVSGGPRACER